MTDSTLLKEKIETSGLKICYISDFVGVSRQTLWKKVNNKTPFDQYQIEKLCEVLRISSLKEKEDIFFANKVDQNVHNKNEKQKIGRAL